MTTITPRLGRVASLVVGSAMAIGLVAAGATPAAAHGVGVPHHQVGGISCERTIVGATVKTYPPRDVRPWGNRRDDVVYWSTVLYQWNGNQWVNVTPRVGWPAYAYVNSYGLSQGRNPGWRGRTSHGQLIFIPHYNLVPGASYAVLHRLYWASSGQVHTHWAPNSCRV